MKDVRSTSGAALAIVLVGLGCGATSRPPKDAAVEHGGTDGTVADSGRGVEVGVGAGTDVAAVEDTDAGADVPARVDGSAGDGTVLGVDAGAGAADLPAPTEVGSDGAVDLVAPDLSAAPDSSSERSAGEVDSSADPGPRPECYVSSDCPHRCTINPKCGTSCVDGRCVDLPCCVPP
jgi:hypothetical protein